jgi:hypothetical protein
VRTKTVDALGRAATLISFSAPKTLKIQFIVSKDDVMT